MEKYWSRFCMEEAGNYCAESDFTDDILHIFRIRRGVWGWCFNKGMTCGTFRTLSDAKRYFGL